MKIDKAIEILKEYNTWRRGSDTEMLSPKVIGVAIDVIIKNYETKTKHKCFNELSSTSKENEINNK